MTEPEPDESDLQEYRVPLIDPDTGEEHDEVVEATSGLQAMARTDDDYHVARPFVEEHTDAELPEPEEFDR